MPNGRRNEIEIETPCPKSWDSLVGDDRRRYCSECELHVHNSAAMTRDEARELARQAGTGDGERVCMRVVRDASGAPVYLDSCSTPVAGPLERPIRLVSKGPRAATWVLAAGAALLQACVDPTPEDAGTDPAQATTVPADPVPVPEDPIELLGEVALPEDCLDPSSEEVVSGCDQEAAMLGRVAPPQEPEGSRALLGTVAPLPFEPEEE